MAILRFNPHPEEELSPEELSALLTSIMPEVPGYRVLRRIGKGGMSYVYLAVQESLDRQVAIKITAPEALRDEVSKQRFEQEARTIAKLEHPCIVGIYEVGRTPQGLMYYVMPYLSKGHLGQRNLQNDEPRIVDVLRALLSALSYAHTRGVVHRDVKAENVLFDNADRPVLADFGIALHARGSVRITGAGMALGSAAYMAPEQARGDAVDLRADIYALGVLCYELLTGELPFQGKDALALAVMHANDPIPRLPAEKRRWQAFIDKAMSKDREARFHNADDMLAALEPLLRRRVGDGEDTSDPAAAVETPQRAGARQPAVAVPHNRVPAAVERPEPPIATPRHGAPRLLWALAGLFVLAAVASVLWVTLQRRATPDFVTATPIPESNLAPEVAAAADPIGAIAAQVGAAPDAGDTNHAGDDATQTPQTQESSVASAPGSTGGNAAALAFRSAPLAYDPSQPAARELQAARRQIDRQRLATPAGDNAYDSLFAAFRLYQDAPPLRPLATTWLQRANGQVDRYLADGKREDALALWGKMRELAEQFGMHRSEAFQSSVAARRQKLRDQLQQATQRRDAAAMEAVAAEARAFNVADANFERQLRDAQAALLPRVGDSVAGYRVIVAPTATSAGWAAQPREVTRGEFSTFVRSSGHTVGRCRGGFLERRQWSDPGFAQDDGHPVVCITAADADAFARWKSQREGRRFALPDRAQWQALSNGAPADCQGARLACGAGEGTVAAASMGADRFGLQGVGGNAREWLRDGTVGGSSWRTSPGRAAPGTIAAVDGDRGADDIGFRLVLELPPGNATR